ncbi:hypothetical protein JRG66_11835 [Salinimicrobium tongyeongense]|uniref:G domain-containing protein n=1 Tax=Salinimicrobium tongyeongense TaxID=2809707 RepID=A0ABY6NPP8_9FLAO|nr:hypothetical protein [Salinimicrobium tongyeongense]UZH54656.1 hypothetical protein JRG66_11835 [Salinimicrobium tongyeongense]
MKSIVIIGKSNEGKSTTIKEICKRLNPSKVWGLKPDSNNYKNSLLKDADVEDIHDNTFIIKVNEQNVLISAGAPTEQEVKITILIDICIELEIEIHLAVVAKRSRERKQGFNTLQELEKFGEVILTERISKIEETNYRSSPEWLDRIERIENTVLSNL